MVGREEDASVARSMFGSVSSMGCALVRSPTITGTSEDYYRSANDLEENFGRVIYHVHPLQLYHPHTSSVCVPGVFSPGIA
jgi:hypothetical protein